MADDQQQETSSRSSNSKRQRIDDKRIIRGVPVLKGPLTQESFKETFLKYRLLHIPKNGGGGGRDDTGGGGSATTTTTTCSKKSNQLTWKDLKEVFQGLDPKDKNSWCIENGKYSTDKASLPENFLDPNNMNDDDSCGYCSFLVQNDKKAKEDMLSRVPISDLSSSLDQKLYYGPSIWIFFGRNQQKKEGRNNNLAGRPEHTDSVSQDGTWHYQLSGTKTWYVRPTKKLLQHIKEEEETTSSGGDDWCESDVLRIDCNDGDLLLIDTCLWWHRTDIPSQPTPSVSYARDFFLQEPKDVAESNNNNNDNNNDDGDGMTNIDGLYASNDIGIGTIIFTETDMPDCALHRSTTNWNCEVVELEDGTNAVISTRNISSGEFFCVAESDSEEEEDDDDDDDDVEEEEEEG